MQQLAGPAWNHKRDLVFTNELGGHLVHFTVYKHFKRIVKEMGMSSSASTISAIHTPL